MVLLLAASSNMAVVPAMNSFRLLLAVDLLGVMSKLPSAFLFLLEAGVDPLAEGPCMSLLANEWS